MNSFALRVRLLEPSVGVVSGGTRVVVHGVGFRPPPHSLTVRFRLHLQDPDEGRANVPSVADVTGRFLSGTQLECVVPDFELQAKRAIAARTSLAASSACVSSAPQLVPLSVEVLLNGGELHSNSLVFRLHQPLEVQRVCPQSVLMASPAITMTSTLNILKLPGPTLSRSTLRAGQRPLEILEDMSVLPVFVRAKQVSERTGAVSEQTREGRWKLSPVGVYEVEFDAVTLGFGAATVELSLNRLEFFRCKLEAPAEAHGYRVHRDVSLNTVEPPCVSVTSGHATEVRLLGDGFADTGDLVVGLHQAELPAAMVKEENDNKAVGNIGHKEVQVAQLTATFYSKNEIRCTVPANLSFGRTSFSVSMNGGRQFGQPRVVGLFFRDRHLESISPGSGSLAGGAQVMIRLSCLSLEEVDCFRQVQCLNPPRRIRVRFQPIGYALPDTGDALTKVAICDAPPDKPGVLICRTPSFLENIKVLNSLKEDTDTMNRSRGGGLPYMWNFTVSVALGGDLFQGALPFVFYLPPVIRSLTQHHGPATGGTCLKLRMKHKVPPQLEILLRFSTLDSTTNVIVKGHAMGNQNNYDITTTTDTLVSAPTAPHENNDENPEYLITCQTPPWTYASKVGAPCLTIVQVSYDSGVTFFPAIDQPLSTLSDPLAKDLSYLCFLFYAPPIVRTAIPPSADIQGGSYIRLQGLNLMDHGSQPSVVFESPTLSRKVTAVVEKGELRCCAPPFNVGLVRVFVSLNGEQYTLCDLRDPETNVPLDFIYYSSPAVTRISPVCACVHQSNEFRIFGTNLIETERIKVRVSFSTSAQSGGRRIVHKDVPGTARNGVITANTPIFSEEYANQSAQVDVALNGADFSGASVPLRYFSRYSITRVDPPLGAFEVPVTLTIHVTPAIITDCVFVRIRLTCIHTSAATENDIHNKVERETIYGPIEAISWTASTVEFTLAPLNSLVESLPSLATAHVELSFDNTHFHEVGNLQEHFRVYNMPQLTSASPLFGVFDRETKLVAHGAYLRSGDVVKVTLFLESGGIEKSKSPIKHRRAVTRKAPVPVIVVVGDVNVKRQRLTWMCPSLAQLRASPDRQLPPFVFPTTAPDRRIADDTINGILLPERVIMQISVVDGQPSSLPFVFRYYRAPTLVAMNPRLGYVCSGSLVSFEFAEPIATPTVDFRFGDSLPMTGRIRDERFVECFSPELSVGSHIISISCNEQHFDPAVIVADQAGENAGAVSSSPATFRAFPLPVFVLPPADRERVFAFGPTTGGTVVVLKGVGFVPDTKIYVRFASTFGDAFDGMADIVVGAKIVDNETIKCISPPCRRLGRVVLHVSYNLQQFSDSTCFFEYHAPTRYIAKETLCGPISGQTPLELFVEDMEGLPSLTQLLHCAVRFKSEKNQALHHLVDIEAEFNPETRILSCITPAWPSNQLVGVYVSLARGDCELFEDTRIKFLFYDPPKGVIKIDPSAGPITGGTEVLAWCGRIVDTGEITVSIDLCSGDTRSPNNRNRSTDAAPLQPKRRKKTLPHAILVKGEIVGEAVRFVVPPVSNACTASLSISLNGINYTSSQTPLHFTYYVEPILRRINPGWAAMEGANDLLTIEGEHIRDFGCEMLVKFCVQDSKQPDVDGIIVPAHFVPNSAASATGDGALQCVFPAATPGYYELEVSLNGQQFSQSLYVNKTYGNLSGTACTALLPFRRFSSPFCLATATGPAAGGSSVVLFLGRKLLKLLAREIKCQVQFSPMKNSDRVMRQSVNGSVTGGINAVKATANVSADTSCIFGEIDHVNARVTCRAPLLRVACVCLVDILLPHGSGVSSACQLYGVRPSEREKYYSYESPSISEIAPSCGPITGGTQLVIEGTNVLDTAQIFVRFRSSLSEREFVLVPGRYSRTFPDGSMSTSSLIICNTPSVEFVDKAVASVGDLTSQNGPAQAQPSPRNRDGAAAGKTRTQTYQMLAEQSLKSQRACLALRSGGHSAGFGTLRITRSLGKNTARANAESFSEGGATVLVDFTVNAGEQFIAHSVRFYYYQEIEARQIKWSPRHLPAQCPGGRQTTDSRILTVTLPKAYRLTEAPERICFRFDGSGVNTVATKRRGSSILLHETDERTELVIQNTSKISMQSAKRQSSTYFKNSVLPSDNVDLNANENRGALTPSRPRSGGQPLYPGKSSHASFTSPCIAAKVITAYEVTCVVPDFSSTGAVLVFFSLNAQQFICLGELLFHPAMTIKDEFHHTASRFCSNVGGELFTLRCSPSTVLKFLAPEDIITAEEQRLQIRNLGLMKTSVALKDERSSSKRDLRRQGFISISGTEQQSGPVCNEADSSDGIGPTDSGGNEETEEEVACDVDEETTESWQYRSFHVVQVVLVPANSKLLKRVTVEVTRVDNRGEVGKMVPDDSGCCVFEISNWSDHVLLTVALPASCGYSSYSTVFEPSLTHHQDKADNRSASSRSYLLVTQIPDPAKIHIVVFGSYKSNFAMAVMTDNGIELPENVITPSAAELLPDNRICWYSLDLTSLVDLASDNLYACVRFNSSEYGLPCNSGNTVKKSSNVQVLVSDCNGLQVCLAGPAVESALWVVARIPVPTKGEPASVANTPYPSIKPVDVCVDLSGKPTLKDILTSFAGVHGLTCTGSNVSGSISPAYTVPVTFDFTCTDSTRSISASSRARLVLSSSDNFQTLLALSLSPQAKNGPTVTLECSMPSLPFSGPAALIVSCGGVPFSNVVRVHCYDPRSWRVLALCPPCGQLPPAEDFKITQDPLVLRIKGEHFVENHKISVRISDKDRYFITSGRMEQVHLLSVRIAAVKNLRLLLHPLGIGVQVMSGATAGTTTLAHKREDTRFPLPVVGATTSGGSIVSMVSSLSTFSFTLRIECGDDKVYASCREVSVLAAISSGSVLSWEEEFELRVASDRTAPLVVTAELSDPSLSKPIELAQAWIPINMLQEGSAEVRRYSARLEEHFKCGFFIGNESALINNSPSPEVDLLLQLSPLLLQPDYIVCKIPRCLLRQLSPQTLDVQVSSGDGVYSTPHCFQVYKPPIVTQTTPSVLPRSAGGDITVTGNGFVNSGRVCIRVFAFSKNFFKSCVEEQQMLATVNHAGRLHRTNSSSDGFTSYFTRYLEGVYMSATSIKFKLPAHLTSYNIYYSLSFDGRSFTEVSHASSILLFSIHAISPKGGPISGSTYTTLQGTNIEACTSSRPGITPLVRVTWKRGSRDLEHVTVPGECYPHEDAVYFYSPQSKFGLSSIAVVIELAFISSHSADGSAPTESFPHFGRDEVLFVMYKTPTIKSVAPLVALISGLSTTEVIVQGFDEKAVGSMRLAPKFRFKRRGQMQVSDAQLVSETRFECLVPRFNVPNAVATELPVSGLTGMSPTAKARSSGNSSMWSSASSSRRPNGPAKLWTRTSGIFVALLGARNLRASKKNACNPFAVVYVGKAQLKSTRKDGSFSPVWNELFDFEWGSVNELSGPLSVRVVLESQLTADQSESLGHVELTFPVAGKLTRPFAFHAWIPVRRIRGKYARKDVDEVTPELNTSRPKKPTTAMVAAPSLGEIELAIAFVPPVTQAKKPKSALRSSVISVLSTHPQPRKSPHAGREGVHTKKEKLLRAFRQRGAPISLVPTELSVELALNGQDFWSAAPSTCHSILTPIVLDIEPKFISIAGGTQLHLLGINFVNSGYLRVAFAMLSENGAVRRAVMVEAKYRSNTGLVCTTPPLLDLATEASFVNVYMSINGVDFDSIALPKQMTKVSETPANSLEATPQLATVDESLEDNNESKSEETVPKSARKKGEIDSDGAIVLENEQYVIDCKKIIAKTVSAGTTRMGRFAPHQPANLTTPGHYILVPQLRVYLVPKITRVRPTDGIYTSHLTIDGANFTNTHVAIARFTSTTTGLDARTAKILVVSSTCMECSVPDFPRGVVVRVAVAMNGVEFVQCPGELRVFQSPRLTEIYPSWVSAATTMELELRGINLSSAVSASPSDDNNRGGTNGVQISFTGTRGKKVVRGVCEDGRVRCSIPREVLQLSVSSRDKVPALMMAGPILVDVWLGGSHSAFTGAPLPLHVYQEIPAVTAVAPMDGPVYGGFAIVVEGRGFVDTGKITVRFQLYKDQQETPRDEDETTTVVPQNQASLPARIPTSLDKCQGMGEKNYIVDGKDNVEALSAAPTTSSFVEVVAKFVSAERVLCPAPSFPLEGVYTVLVALNGVEFSKVSDGSWFLAWQNWQKRKRLLSHAIFSRATASEEATSATAIAGSAAASASLDEEDVERLRHKSSFMLPKIKSAMPGGPVGSAPLSSRHRASVVDDNDNTLRANPQLLQWYPTSSEEERMNDRSLLSLLEYLCSTNETKQLTCRRLRVAFRLESAQTRNHNESTGGPWVAIRFSGFVRALRMIFPNATSRDLEEIWHSTGHQPDGTMTIKHLLRRLQRNVGPKKRSSSPEPGPTHYNPRYSAVSSRETSALILPPTVQPERIPDLPSSFFMDYDAGVHATKPQSPRTVFRKRQFNTSWCNPVVDNALGGSPPKPRPPTGIPTSRSSPRSCGEIRVPPSKITSATDIATSSASVAGIDPISDVTAATARVENNNGVPVSFHSEFKKSGQNVPQAPVDVKNSSVGVVQSRDELNSAEKEDVIQTALASPIPTIDRGKASTKTSRGATNTTTSSSGPSYSSTLSNVSPSIVLPQQPSLGGSNPFYNDISPLYAKFLNSAEVQKSLKQ